MSSRDLNIALWIVLNELLDSCILDYGGCLESSLELNIGLWRVLGELMDS